MTCAHAEGPRTGAQGRRVATFVDGEGHPAPCAAAVRRLLYLSPVPLDSFAQRPHHFVEWFHRRHGGTVLWVEPGPVRLPRVGDLRRLAARLDPRHAPVGPPWADQGWIRRLQVPALPLEPLAAGRMLNRWLRRGAQREIDAFVTPDTCIVVGKPCALALELSSRYPGIGVVFDVMDRHSDFFEGRSRRWVQHAETQLAQRARWLVVSSTALSNTLHAHRDKTCIVLNGVVPPGTTHEDGSSDLAVVGQHAPLAAWPVEPSGEALVFGYVGTIDRWFDWGAVVRLALAHPGATFKLVGPCGLPPPGPLPANVHLDPPIPQHAVHALLCTFHVGLIPFRRSPLTDHVDPVKYYEYRTAGLPVLSTRFGEMALRGPADGVLFIDPPPADLPSLAQVLALRATAEQAHSFARQHAWARRFDTLDILGLAHRPESDAMARSARSAHHWNEWQIRQAATPLRFTDWGDHPTVLQEVYRHAFGDPTIGFLEFIAARYPALRDGHALSLCCGDGAFERTLLDRGIFGQITGFEMALQRIEAGRMASGDRRLDFEQVDVNLASYGQARFDVVFAKAALHHIENLEHAFEQIARCLRPGGLLITIDFFGPSRFQWTDAQLRACNEFWAEQVPAPLKVRDDGSPFPPVTRPRVEDMIAMDPSEAVRSGELHHFLLERFEPEHDIPLGGALLNLLLAGERVNRFDPDDQRHVQILRRAAARERELMGAGVLGSDFRFVIARPRARRSARDRAEGA